MALLMILPLNNKSSNQPVNLLLMTYLKEIIALSLYMDKQELVKLIPWEHYKLLKEKIKV
jgi:hypothetical protein